MEQVLQQLGLNAKETNFYLYLLKNTQKTGAELAKELGETRTNTYMVLGKLIETGLVELEVSSPARHYSAANPEKLKGLLTSRQQQLRQAHSGLSSVLPELGSIFNLTQHKPGIIYFEGIEGYKAFQEDSFRLGEPISIIASLAAPENKQAWDEIQKVAQKRNKNNIETRILFHTDAKNWLDVPALQAKGYEVRFWGETPLEGEIAIYGNKVGLTAYQPVLITTVITNEVIAGTFRAIFEQLWDAAKTPV